ncbi:tyrosine-type recombinase/integrase [Magnetospirillum molischianum]|uniref:Integrase n=1 Tax=Magnetospirillum molischianum DSM 120 TaxID=1150626 RepID=H8FWV7_MAGML|nr:site-specific integrase [Magnetospirillum molischianum]CCG42845.1 Integrase [Magnetospirillum molischianum DSM 120]
MKQAKVLSEAELKRVIALVASQRHAARNRMAVMLSFYAGMRVGEIAALTIGDVLDGEGRIRDQIILRAETTKRAEARAVFVNGKLRREFERYLSVFPTRDRNSPFLMTQKDTAFSPNTLCQLFGRIYKDAGIDGASSHSGRRWFITRLAHSGVSPKVIMTLAGHRNLSTTQRYIEVNDHMMRAAVEGL